MTGSDEFEAETYFPMLGMSIQVLPPGEPNGTYHWETGQEDFLVLVGGALVAYARFLPSQPTRYRESLLPD